MLAKLRTFSLLGIEALPVEVEVDVSPGALPKTVLEAAVKESIHRNERAMVNSGFTRPQDRVVINLAPAELPKQAASFDLADYARDSRGERKIGTSESQDIPNAAFRQWSSFTSIDAEILPMI
jgi:hypothetical protein